MPTQNPDTAGHEEMRLFELDAPEPAIAEADLVAPTFKRALVSIMDELLAMDERRVLPINVDLSAAATLVIGAARDIRALRPEMVRKFGEEEASAVDRLELLARAVAQAQARHTLAESEDDLPRLAAAVAEERAALLAEVASLAARKRLSRSALGPLRGGRGLADLGSDVLQLVAFLTNAWGTIEKASGYTMEEIERAEGLANQLITAVGRRDRGPRSSTADIRQRAFSLLYETYHQVRRMVGYLRWNQGDADRIAPSLQRARKGRRPARAVVEAADAPTEADLGPSGPREVR